MFLNVYVSEQKLKIRGGLSFTNLIPQMQNGIVNLKRYVYKGSLPTPPCYESVTWIVFKRPIDIRINKVSDMLYYTKCLCVLSSGNNVNDSDISSNNITG